MKKIYLLTLLTILISCKNNDNQNNTKKGNDFDLFANTEVYKLAKAVERQDCSEINSLLEKGLDINYQEGKFGQTLLILSVKNGLNVSVECLLKNKADVNIHDRYDGSSAIIEASKISKNFEEDITILKMLLEYGANPNDIELGKRRDNNLSRNTPLIVSSKCCLKKVELLIQAGANINYVNEFNQSALYSALNGYEDKALIVKYLLNNGADYNMVFKKDINGKDINILTKLRKWTYKLDSENYKIKMEIVQFLKKNGLNYRETEIPKKYFSKYSSDYLEKY